MKKILVLKQQLKALAVEIRKAKIELKEYQRTHCGCSDGRYCKVFKLKYDFRHKHLAYCLLRGTERAKIETPSKSEKKPYTKPDETYIQEVIHEYTEVAQDVCVSA